MRKPEVWAKWRRLVAEQERDGQTAAAFCDARRISRTHFSAWKRRLREAGPAPFVEVRVAEPAAGRAIEIRVGRRRVLVEPGFDAAHLRAVLAALEERA